MNKPNPVPLSDFVTNFENKRGNISGSIPGPVSFTLTRTLSSVLNASIEITPSEVNFIAFLRRFKITCVILPLSASTKILLGVDDILTFLRDYHQPPSVPLDPVRRSI